MWNILLRNKSEGDSYSLQVEKRGVKWEEKWSDGPIANTALSFSQNQLIQCQRFKQEQGLDVLLRAKNASLFDYIQHSWEKNTGKYILTQAGVEPIISLLTSQCRDESVRRAQSPRAPSCFTLKKGVHTGKPSSDGEGWTTPSTKITRHTKWNFLF